jgi:hypothetical protein
VHSVTDNDGKAPEGVERFVQRCQLIRLSFWQQIQTEPSPSARSIALKAACREYQRSLSPRLETILQNYCASTRVISEARNAAAKLLNSLASGFIAVKDLESSEALATEALRLVFQDAELRAEVNVILAYIVAEKKRIDQHKHAADKVGREPVRGRYANPPIELVTESALGEHKRIGKFQRRWLWVFSVGIAVVTLTMLLMSSRNAPISKSFVVSAESSGPAIGIEQAPLVSTEELVAPSGRAALRVAIAVPPIRAARVSKAVPMVDKFAMPDAVIVPQPTPHLVVAPELARVPFSLPNGTTLIEPHGPAGLGRINVSNHTGQDAVVKVKTVSLPRTTIRFVYAKAGGDIAIPGIPVGDYLLQFSTGKDWDEVSQGFRQKAGFAQFERSLSFTEATDDRVDGSTTTYSVHEVTLHTVPNGNARKIGITAAEFAAGLGVGHVAY